MIVCGEKEGNHIFASLFYLTRYLSIYLSIMAFFKKKSLCDDKDSALLV